MSAGVSLGVLRSVEVYQSLQKSALVCTGLHISAGVF